MTGRGWRAAVAPVFVPDGMPAAPAGSKTPGPKPAVVVALPAAVVSVAGAAPCVPVASRGEDGCRFGRDGNGFLDEPTAGLDPSLSETFVELIATLHREMRLTVVMVTHDLDTMLALSTKIAVLADKKVIVYGSAKEVVDFRHPFLEAPQAQQRSP
jgi:hypothetical protein